MSTTFLGYGEAKLGSQKRHNPSEHSVLNLQSIAKRKGPFRALWVDLSYRPQCSAVTVSPCCFILLQHLLDILASYLSAIGGASKDAKIVIKAILIHREAATVCVKVSSARPLTNFYHFVSPFFWKWAARRPPVDARPHPIPQGSRYRKGRIRHR